jgi:hypothetical protein
VQVIPLLLPESEPARRAAFDALLRVLGARGALPEEDLRRLTLSLPKTSSALA